MILNLHDFILLAKVALISIVFVASSSAEVYQYYGHRSIVALCNKHVKNASNILHLSKTRDFSSSFERLITQGIRKHVSIVSADDISSYIGSIRLIRNFIFQLNI